MIRKYTFPYTTAGKGITEASRYGSLALPLLGIPDFGLVRYGVPALVNYDRLAEEAGASWRGLDHAKRLGADKLSLWKRMKGHASLLGGVGSYAADPAIDGGKNQVLYSLSSYARDAADLL
jgi:hypothetical protein